MATVTHDPTGATSSGGTLVGGTALAVVSDASDATYWQSTGGGALTATSFAALVLPAGAQIRSVSVTVRHNYTPSAAPGDPLTVTLGPGSSNPKQFLPPTTGTATDSTYGPFTRDGNGSGWTTANLAPVTVQVTALGNGTVTQLYRLQRTVVYNEQPVVSAVSMVAADLASVTYTYTDPESDGQEARRIKVFSSAVRGGGGFDPETSTAVYDSGLVYATLPSATFAAPPVPLGVRFLTSDTYYAYVKAADAGSNLRFSPWVSSPGTTVAVTLTAPTLAVADVPSIGGVSLTVTNNDSATVPTVNVVVQRSADSGSTWADVPRLWLLYPGPPPTFGLSATSLFTGLPQAAGVIAGDPESPHAVSLRYRARTWTTTQGAPWSAEQTIVAPARATWLKDPVAPIRNWMFPADAPLAAVRHEPQTALVPLGAAYPVVLTGTIQGEQVSGTLLAVTEADRAAFEVLRAAQRTLLLQAISGRSWYVRLGADVTTTSVEASETGYDAAYTVALNAMEVAAP